jgi:mRNA-degrading endonuclease toxin of MazEF toxin-antitoxin module
MILRPGEVVLIRVDFLQAPGRKVRPSIVLLDAEDDDFVGAPVTSHPCVSAFDVPIQQWREAGLNMPSTARIHKLTAVSKNRILRRLGDLAVAGRDAVNEVLRRALSLNR